MFDFSLNKNVKEKDILSYQKKVNEINKKILDKTGEGKEFLGWVDWPNNYDKKEVQRIIKDSKYVRDNFEVLVVCGIGGSYLGSKAGCEALKGKRDNDKIKIIFLGQTFSPTYTYQIIDYLKDKKFAINVVSKSGTTTETALSFRLLKDLIEEKVGKKEAKKTIYVTTDKCEGKLKELADKEGYTTYVLPGDIGGRFSVLTPVGLFPFAVAGANIKNILKGASLAKSAFDNPDLKTNACYRYAVSRDFLYRHNYPVEMFITFEPHLSNFSGWLRQLFGESEGKENKGLFPVSSTFSTDLHSIGQFIQQGSPVLFETFINIKNPKYDIVVPKKSIDFDGLKYLEGKKLSFINQKAFEGTLAAHSYKNRVPCNVITIDNLNEKELGYLFYFFMRACAMSAYLLEINPFNQPGVDLYKKNMFHLLGKKGF